MYRSYTCRLRFCTRTEPHSCLACRLNLSEGCFLAPLPTQAPAVNACVVCPAHGLFAAAGEDGTLECFDLRQRRSAGVIDAAAAAGAVRIPCPAASSFYG